MPVNDSTRKQLPAIVRVPKDIIQLLIFLLIQIPLLPVAVIGLVVVTVKELLGSKRIGSAASAIEVLHYRWIFHYFRTREDEVSVKITKGLPTTSHYGLLGFFAAAIIANRICGFSMNRIVKPADPGKESLLNIGPSRTAFFDRTMKDHLPLVEQVVLMGAGFDSRPFKFCRDKNVKVFELDEEQTQKLKIEALQKAGFLPPEHDWINFVPVDFEQESWVEKLVESGFDTSKKTFFLWEGVTFYLQEEAVKQTLRTVASSSGKGSVITFDFYSKELAMGKLSKVAKKTMESGWAFGIDHEKNPREAVENLLKEAGLTLGELSLMGKGGKVGGLVVAMKP